MNKHVSVITRKGQVTVPADIRRVLGLKVGDRVAFALSDTQEREVSLRPVRSVADLTYGAVSPRQRPEDFQELRHRFEEGAAEEVRAEAAPAAHEPA